MCVGWGESLSGPGAGKVREGTVSPLETTPQKSLDPRRGLGESRQGGPQLAGWSMGPLWLPEPSSTAHPLENVMTTGVLSPAGEWGVAEAIPGSAYGSLLTPHSEIQFGQA